MSLLSRLKGLLQIHRLEHDLDDELLSHIEMRTEDNLAAGMSPAEARYDAQRRFGNSTLVKEETRTVDVVGWIETTGENLRYAGRTLRRSPGFTLVAIVTLALGIGANVAIFTVVEAVLLRPLPFPHPEQLVRVYDDIRSSNTHDVGMSVPELWDLRDHSGVFQDISVIFPADANITGGERPELNSSGPTPTTSPCSAFTPSLAVPTRLPTLSPVSPNPWSSVTLTGTAASAPTRTSSARKSAWMATFTPSPAYCHRTSTTLVAR